HRARPAARQDQIPAGRVRIDAARLYAPAIAAHGRGARRGPLAQAEFSPLGRAAGAGRGDRRDQRRHWRPAGAACPLPPRGLARAAGPGTALARGPAHRGLTPSFRRLTALEGRSILGGHLPLPGGAPCPSRSRPCIRISAPRSAGSISAARSMTRSSPNCGGRSTDTPSPYFTASRSATAHSTLLRRASATL